MTRPNIESLRRLIEQREAKQRVELVDHPNPAITVWGMLPGTHYGAVVTMTKRGQKVEGYTIRVGNERRYMPIKVAQRLLKDGKIERTIGDLYITVNAEWGQQ